MLLQNVDHEYIAFVLSLFPQFLLSHGRQKVLLNKPCANLANVPSLRQVGARLVIRMPDDALFFWLQSSHVAFLAVIRFDEFGDSVAEKCTLLELQFGI